MLPFTHDEFLAVFAAYNEALWPAAAVAYLLAGAIAWAIAGRAAIASRLAAFGLAALWLWTGIAYHWEFFVRVNPAAAAFGGAFVAQGALLVAAGRRGSLDLSAAPPGGRAAVGWALIAYSAIVYPILGLVAGQRYPAMPLFGITPCPLTIFTLGVFLLAARTPWWLLPVPVAWSLVGSTAAWRLGIPQDWALLAAAGAAVAFVGRDARAGHAAAS